MSLMIEIFNEQNEVIPNQIIEILNQALTEAARFEGVDEQEVVITLVDNEAIQKLNNKFRQIDRETDVLSFPLDEEDALGDIIISIPRAKEQAEEYGHSFEREMAFLTVHGFLHLLGYDHHTEVEEKEMFSRQEAILAKCGLTREG
jgi:probable rRNA maturation factor